MKLKNILPDWLVDPDHTQTSNLRTDRILPETRLLAFVVVPFLLGAFMILTLWPGDTALLFAWTVTSPMTALMLGAVFGAGAYYFSRVYLCRRWHEVSMGFIPIALFTTMMAFATLVHWDSFNHSSPTFIIWVLAYSTVPWLVLLLWYRNRGQDTRMPTQSDVVVMPRALSIVLTGLGICNMLIALFMYILPDTAVTVWPWAMTTMGARMVGSLFALMGATSLQIANERRWSALKTVLETLAVAMGLILLGMARSWNAFALDKPLTYVFTFTAIFVFLSTALFYVWVETRKVRLTQHERPE